MILTCPQCATQYRLKEGAIPPEGRQVRCAACKHKWHEPGPAEGAKAAPAEAPAPAPAAPVSYPPAAPSAAEAGVARPGAAGERSMRRAPDDGIGGGPPQPRPAPVEPLAEIPEDALRGRMIAENPEPDVSGHEAAAEGPTGNFASRDDIADSSQSPSATAEPWGPPRDNYPADEQDFAAIPAMHSGDQERRGGKVGWIIGLVLIVVAAAAAFYFLAPPELKARAGIAEAGGSPLQLMLTTSDRQKLASGNELLAISGRVINATDRVQAVPPIHAELRDPATNRLVYEWTIAPPARSLAPGAAASFNSAEVDVPQGGESLSLRFAS